MGIRALGTLVPCGQRRHREFHASALGHDVFCQKPSLLHRPAQLLTVGGLGGFGKLLADVCFFNVGESSLWGGSSFAQTPSLTLVSVATCMHSVGVCDSILVFLFCFHREERVAAVPLTRGCSLMALGSQCVPDF